jgi:selenium metabolism protein YedF
MKRVDVRGKQCPLPIIETKKALREGPEGETLEVLIDNETSLGNVCKFLDDNNCTWHKRKEGNYWILIVSPGSAPIADTPAGEYCEVQSEAALQNGTVIVLSSETMGEGDEVLGKRLIASYVNILTELDTLPSAVVCYNGGVRLALADSPVVDTLAELERRGVEVILCGTCMDFFDIKGKTRAGIIGDMYKIANLIAGASSVFKP